jgi:hypothetical protein
MAEGNCIWEQGIVPRIDCIEEVPFNLRMGNVGVATTKKQFIEQRVKIQHIA